MPRIAWTTAALALAMAGCRIATTPLRIAPTATPTPTPAPTTTPTTTRSERAAALARAQPSAGTVVSPTGEIQARPDEPRAGVLYRHQIEALRGMTPDQARKRLAELGHVGKVVVGEVLRFNAACGQGAVCGTDHDGGMGVTDDIVLELNPRLVITAPP